MGKAYEGADLARGSDWEASPGARKGSRCSQVRFVRYAHSAPRRPLNQLDFDQVRLLLGQKV